MLSEKVSGWWSVGWRARLFPLLGAGLALGSPTGLLAVRAFRSGALFDGAFYGRELLGNLETYVYLVLSTVIVFVVIGWWVGRSQDELVDDSLKDPVTELANRRQFDRRLALELRRAKRYEFPVTLMMIDVDRLKSINDRGGHQAGDTALRLVAHAIRGTCRSTDLPARFGGDEFVVMAPHTISSEAAGLAHRLLETLNGVPLADVGPVSVSVGIVDTREIAGDVGARAMIEAADRALYQAKHDGRGVVRMASLIPSEATNPI